VYSFVGARNWEANSLSLYTLIFHAQMPTKMKDYSGAKHSNATVTPDRESVKSSEKQYDFSELNDYFTTVTTPDELVSDLEALYTDYPKMALYIAIQENCPDGYLMTRSAADRLTYLYNLELLTDLLKQMK
jgi:hypothetical protein